MSNPFTSPWFAEKLWAAILSADRRYTPNAHVSLPLTRNLDWLGRTETFYQEWREHSAKYEKQCERLYVFGAMARGGLLPKRRAVRIESQFTELGLVVRNLTNVRFEKIGYSKPGNRVRALLKGLRPIVKTVEALRSQARPSVAPQSSSTSSAPQGEPQVAAQPSSNQTDRGQFKLSESDLDGFLHQLREIIGLLDETSVLADELPARLSNEPALLLVGEAGIGKTHLLCDLGRERLKGGYPTVLVLAHQLPAMDDPLQAVIGRLGLVMDNDAFLSQLNRVARQRRKRALILIDAINESDRSAWRKHLPGILEHCRRYPGLGVVISCRSPFHLTTIPKRARLSRLTHQGFHERELDAVRTYFKEFNLPLPEVPLLAAEFSNPLFLKIFCESLEHAVVKKKHARIREISSGQEGMLNVFEDFVVNRARRVAASFKLQPLAVWRMMKEGVAALMAAKGRPYITLSEAYSVFRAHGVPRGSERQFVRELGHEGLLSEDVVYDVPRHATEVVRLPYQKFSDHLIARYLLKGFDKADPAKSLAAGTPLGNLLWPAQGLRPYPSVVEAVLIEFPERAGQRELFDFIPKVDVELARLFLNGLLWRKPSSFGPSTAKYINRILKHELLADEMLSALLGLATKPKHPFGIKSLDAYLRRMKMPDRDIFWSEFLRHQYDESVVYRLLTWLETYDAFKLTEEYGEVYVAVLRWFLTTTNRRVRDRATKGLYVVGKQHPGILFKSVLDSFSIDDPYVSERMLAAAYGVVMALQFPPENDFFRRESLGPFARQLYLRMFKRGAMNATTHILARDYARHIVEAALLHVPDLLTRREIADVRPPFRFGGVRRWGRSPDRDKARASPGSPLAPDFENYTLGSLVQGRNNWDLKHAGFKEVLENIYWRVYRLGYSFAKFEKIDKEIHDRYWRSEDGNRVERYGKKYSRIAFFELAGYRADIGVSKRNSPDQRIPEVDIDPSFPVDLPQVRIIRADFIGQDKAPVAHWIKFGQVPNLRPYLCKSTLEGRRGPWLLLDASIEQRDIERHRSIMISLRTLLVKQSDRGRILGCLSGYSAFQDNLFPSEEQTYYTFAGEIPWGDTFPLLTFEEKLELRTGKRFVERISSKNATLVDLLSHPRDGSAEEQGFLDIERSETLEFEAESAVRTHCWESYHTTMTPGLNVPVLTKEIASFSGLTSRPQTFDLFDRNGRRVTFCTEIGEAFGAHEKLLFCKKAVLDRYLRYKGLHLIGIVWGERRFWAKDPGLLDDFAKKETAYSQFSYVV